VRAKTIIDIPSALSSLTNLFVVSIIVTSFHFCVLRQPSGGVESGQTLRVPLLLMDHCDEDGDKCSCIVDDDDAMARRQQQQQRWRDGLCACFRYGLCHPHMWNAWLCPQILLGQLLVRMNMTQRMVQNPFQNSKDGDENNNNKSKNTVDNDSSSNNSSSSTAASIQSAFRKIMVLVILLSLYDALVAPPLFEVEMDEDTGEVSIVRGGGFPVWHQLLYLLLSFPMTVWGVMVVVRLRAAIRHKYRIPTGRLGPCEDFVCVCCCNCCVMGQMARQTADYDGDEPASCCSPNGIRMDDKKRRNDEDDDNDSYYDEEENSNTNMEDSLLLRSPVPFDTRSSSFSSSTSSTILISCNSDHSASSSSSCKDYSPHSDVCSSSSSKSNNGPLILATIV
jgi:Cys-rich protein (TIGR01571 family)